MKLSEKAAYLKGLADGLGLNDENAEQKVLRGMIDLLTEMSEKVENLDDEVGGVCEELDSIETDLYEDDDEADEDGEEEEDTSSQYELTCPKCGAVTVVDEDTLMSQEIVCSNCGTPFDIEFGEKDEDTKENK